MFKMNVSESRVATRVVLLTPEECEKLLSNNEHNRPPSKQAIRLYADLMRRGQWRLNGEPIIIAENGDVMDGQHRLYACIEAGVPFETLIVYNIRRDSFATIDTGKTRNGADVLAINGLSPDMARICSAAAGLCIVFQKAGSLTQGSGFRYLVTPEKRAQWVEDNVSIIDIVQKITAHGRHGRIMAAGDIAFMWFFMEQKNKDCTEEFFSGLLSGAYLGEKDPRLIMRQRLESFKNASRQWTRPAKIGAVIRAWDWFCRGKEVLYPNNMLRDFSTAIDLLK